ncbi:hypothetical protein COM83_04440 [Bacillus cereus]|nr:hypothetical protein COM83_04440 [Bacillus cereus]PFJ46026.1 hypothetical protein COI99_26780 [Bacillus cereus]PFW04110.1 hypothetical protein COL18_30285 [Bacillus cereus]PGW93311.1 hypothetical protein COE40_29120 [Bacillus cereus]PGY19796.1 hypothetical protein COE16_16950 [Bacillus cereus]
MVSLIAMGWIPFKDITCFSIKSKIITFITMNENIYKRLLSDSNLYKLLSVQFSRKDMECSLSES